MAKVFANYRSISFSRQREMALWIGDTKKPETRRHRINIAIDELRAKKGPK